MERSWGNSKSFRGRWTSKNLDFPKVFQSFCNWAIFPSTSTILSYLAPSCLPFGLSWGHLGALLDSLGDILGSSRAILGLPWALKEPPWGHLGAILVHLGAISGLLGAILKLPWRPHGPPWCFLGPWVAYLWPTWSLLGTLGTYCAPSWPISGDLGAILGSYGGYLGDIL